MPFPRSGHDGSGTTPVSPDEERWLIPSVVTLAELNLLERENILAARRWLFSPRRKLNPANLLDHLLVRELHRRMFRRVWRWAGKIRDIDLNLGVPVPEITTRLTALLGDAQAWIDYTTFPADETCVRLHHGLVAIHPWRNGNGRHARLLADRLAVALDRPIFTWGGGSKLTASGETRSNYLTALKAADAGDFASLLAFSRS
ncbi:mobile mystery protein B [Synoicihabitans lomoniglobus]|uniref:Mobile mystery protein B n=1 Tax=Synoicihabitans lomoniglobus TaxID=2909285 RepID=A0AAF0CP09_9BACT|nr:mobile mystery protein B [Opitutaceae bacterium LMO-M01]WED65391.1 mobile mystery protein B [Opitutaceae bacterium LMO-M01]